nr:aconitase X [uncultured Clostridium sp.]
MASNGAVGLYHVEELIPEAVKMEKNILSKNQKIYVIDDKELECIMMNYPVIWKKADSKPKLAFIVCPHLSFSQLVDWTEKLSQELKQYEKRKIEIPTVFFASPAVCKHFEETIYYKKLMETGAILSYICPLMYMNNNFHTILNCFPNLNQMVI